MAPTLEGSIEPSAVSKESGHAFVVTVDPARSLLFDVHGAAVGQQASGALVLFEDGRALGPADSDHDHIRFRGRGGYSHWNTTLYFSTSDNSDPRSNGRRYSFRVEAEARRALQQAGKTAAVAALMMWIGWLWSAQRSGHADRFAARLGKDVGTAIIALGHHGLGFTPKGRVGQGAVVVLFGLAGVVTLLLQWRLGVSGHLGVGSLLPVSDAMGYYRCAFMGAEGSATALAALPPGASTSLGIPGEWCSRRAIWPLTMISVLFVTGWHAGMALQLQAFLMGAALGVLVVSVWRVYGLVPTALIAWLGSVFAIEWAVGTFMTENWGVVAGFTGAALLIEHARRPHGGVLAAGLAMVSVALAARAGALFVLPMLLLWGYMTLLPRGRRWSVTAFAVPLAALMVGPALQWAGAHHYVADVSNTGGNFGPSLYGLSTGSRDWSQAYRDFAPLFAQKPESEVFRIVQRRAIENILDNPTVFIDSLGAAGVAFSKSLFTLGAGAAARVLLGMLLVAGMLYCAKRWRDPVLSLPLLVFAGECLAAPLIIDSGGQRVFAATIWVRPLLAGIGAAALLGLVVRLLMVQPERNGSLSQNDYPAPALALAFGTLVLSSLPLLVASGALRPEPTSEAVACGPGEIPAMVRVGRESIAVTVSGEAAFPLRGPLAVRPGRLETDTRWRESWWSNGTGPLPGGSTIIAAFDARPAARGQLLSVFSEQPLPTSATGVYRLCAGEPLKRTLGDFPLRALVRVEALDSPGLQVK
jgi:hypothetical protein